MRERILRQLKIHGLAPRKGLGQNFLIDPEITRRIVASAGVNPGDPVLEIGPGLGSLTIPLLEKVKTLWALERDEKLAELLRVEAHGVGDLTILDGDALQVDYAELAQQLGGPLHLVANLPYNISTPLVGRFLDQRHAFASMTLMFQREVALRLAAAPGNKDYGALTVWLRLWADAHVLFDVPPSAFHPPPKVVSSVIHIRMRPAPRAELADPERFHRIVKAAFAQRRKTLRNTLKPLGAESVNWLEAAGIDPGRRGETLSFDEFVALYRAAEAAA
ncbi:16S rRNA (adenine(1518)-N(6)/adenine(1519)-N(6))-dimethyltransferase RsmA [Magnetofaba australis]|uniref:Ribosomal RNA small subunit methyltransferase A n=1 Tax=Magnetofaba australis IT-1 TaxID=1434232 RepID=A0A1Y2K6U1_9PROT|nr:16S rRNA (adenine(1518)-N(6)/adenine(1519)-N(6))-dimethyltransferase RsmA [Magnetofaba australis]OSM05260.1 putative dimethyladenosine transferase [Magnetofaba australis IT-1]